MTMGDWESEGIMVLTSKAISSGYARRIHNLPHKVRENPKLVKNDIDYSLGQVHDGLNSVVT